MNHPLTGIIVPAQIELKDGFKTTVVKQGEQFLLTAISIELVEGKAHIITEIGVIEIPIGYDEDNIKS